MMFDKHKRVCRQYRTDPFSPGSPSSPCQGNNRNEYLVTVGCKKKKKNFFKVPFIGSPCLLALQRFLQLLKIPTKTIHDILSIYYFSPFQLFFFFFFLNQQIFETHLVSVRTIKTNGSLKNKNIVFVCHLKFECISVFFHNSRILLKNVINEINLFTHMKWNKTLS